MRRFFSFFLMIGLFLLLACNLPLNFAPAPAATPDDMATLVSHKLTQIAVNASPTPQAATVTVLPASTATPEPPATNLMVVYAQKGNIWLWKSGAAPLQLTFSGSDDHPRLSADGQVVVFNRDGELYAIRPDGGQEWLLVSRSYLDAYKVSGAKRMVVNQFGFWPNSHVLYFDLMAESGGMPVPNADLHRVDPEIPVPSLVLNPGKGGGRWVFSPDGQQVAIVQAERIFIMHPDGSNYRSLFKFKRVSTYADWVYYPEVVWIKSSSGFYTVIPPAKARENPNEPARFYFIPLQGEAARLAELKVEPVFSQNWPYIAPDGTHVLYARKSGDSVEFHMIDASTADKPLLVCNCGLLGWARDGKSFLYWRDTPSQVWIFYPDSTTALAGDTPAAAQIRWVDDQTILYLYTNGDTTELRLRHLLEPSAMLDDDVSDFDFATP